MCYDLKSFLMPVVSILKACHLTFVFSYDCRSECSKGRREMDALVRKHVALKGLNRFLFYATYYICPNTINYI